MVLRFPRPFAAHLVVAAFLSAVSCASVERPAPAPGAATEVAALLNAQVAAWNRQDLDGFLAGYWRSPDTVFFTREGSSRGFDETAARYRKSYDRPAKFGVLSFDDLAFASVDPETMMIQGAWRLRRKSDEPHGRFVLVARKFVEGWRLVSDYTTSDPPPPIASVADAPRR